jgi:hypothetical protein
MEVPSEYPKPPQQELRQPTALVFYVCRFKLNHIIPNAHENIMAMAPKRKTNIWIEIYMPRSLQLHMLQNRYSSHGGDKVFCGFFPPWVFHILRMEIRTGITAQQKD